MVAKFTGKMNDTEISIQENQMFLVFHTNREIVRKGFHALIMESKYSSEIRNYIIGLILHVHTLRDIWPYQLANK